MKVSPKRLVLMTASVVLMIASYLVDGAIADADTRDVVREELKAIEEERNRDK